MSLSSADFEFYLDTSNYVGYSDEELKEIRSLIKTINYPPRDNSVFLHKTREEIENDFLDISEDHEYNEPEDILILDEANSMMGFFERYEAFALYNTRALLNSNSQETYLYRHDKDQDYDDKESCDSYQFFHDEEDENESDRLDLIAARNEKIAFERRYHDIKDICFSTDRKTGLKLRDPNRKIETKPRRKSKRINRDK